MNKLASFLLVLIAALQIGGVAFMSGHLTLAQVAGTHAQLLISHGITAPILGAILQAIEFLIVLATLRKYMPNASGISNADRANIVAELQAKMKQDLEKKTVQQTPYIKGRKLEKLLLAGMALKLLNVGEPVGDKDAGN